MASYNLSGYLSTGFLIFFKLLDKMILDFI